MIELQGFLRNLLQDPVDWHVLSLLLAFRASVTIVFDVLVDALFAE